jgi:hypothetical protein
MSAFQPAADVARWRSVARALQKVAHLEFFADALMDSAQAQAKTRGRSRGAGVAWARLPG